MSLRRCEGCDRESQVEEFHGCWLCADCEEATLIRKEAAESLTSTITWSGVVRKLFRENTKPVNYILRDIPRAIDDKLKIMAVKEHKTKREVMIDAFRRHVGYCDPKS